MLLSGHGSIGPGNIVGVNLRGDKLMREQWDQIEVKCLVPQGELVENRLWSLLPFSRSRWPAALLNPKMHRPQAHRLSPQAHLILQLFRRNRWMPRKWFQQRCHLAMATSPRQTPRLAVSTCAKSCMETVALRKTCIGFMGRPLV